MDDLRAIGEKRIVTHIMIDEVRLLFQVQILY